MIFPIKFSVTVLSFDQLNSDSQGHIIITFSWLHFSSVAILPPEEEASAGAGPGN